MVDYSDTDEVDIFVTPKELQIGMPPHEVEIASSSRQSILRLGKLNICGLNIVDDLRVEASKEFMEDDSFIENSTFQDFWWKSKTTEYVEKVSLERSLHHELPKKFI